MNWDQPLNLAASTKGWLVLGAMLAGMLLAVLIIWCYERRK
jgi:hypothetical protein